MKKQFFVSCLAGALSAWAASSQGTLTMIISAIMVGVISFLIIRAKESAEKKHGRYHS